MGEAGGAADHSQPGSFQRIVPPGLVAVPSPR